MRVHRTREKSFRRIAALALCLTSAALLSACETRQDAREAYSDLYARPAPGSKIPPATYYTVIVHDGDSLSAISARYNTSPSEIMRINNLSTGDTIHPGEELRVPPTSSTHRAVLREATNNRLAPAPEYTPNQKIIVRREPDITPRRRTASVAPAPTVAPSSPQSIHSGQTFSSGFASPVSGKLIAAFGSTASGERNDGINIAAATGTPIHAAADGVVTYEGNELKGYGNLILITHGEDYVTAYAHANSIGVARGQRVSRGDVIGTVGQTGDVTTPQLHFEVRRDMKPVDPRPLLTAER
jgi:murein DD-endopeptidase MepM/ murein hydrolase activator NlpD